MKKQPIVLFYYVLTIKGLYDIIGFGFNNSIKNFIALKKEYVLNEIHLHH